MRNYGKTWVIVLAVVLGVIAIGAMIYIGGYNKAVNLDEEVNTAWANVDAALQRRLDLIPNLVSTVKGYAEHEKELFENIAQSREKYFATDSKEGKIEASNELTGLLSRLLVLREAYPELKANQNFLALQDSLEGTENRIAVARTRYNEVARKINQYRRQIFGSFFARRAGIDEPAPYFEAAEGAETVPQVVF